MKIVYEQGKYVDSDTGEVLVPKNTEEEFAFNRQIEYQASTKLNFGKFKGKSLKKVFKESKSYVEWMVNKGFNIPQEVLNKFARNVSALEVRTLASVFRVPVDDNFRIYSGVSFDGERMVDNVEVGFAHFKAHLNEKHWDHAFDEDDICIGDDVNLF